MDIDLDVSDFVRFGMLLRNAYESKQKQLKQAKAAESGFDGTETKTGRLE